MNLHSCKLRAECERSLVESTAAADVLSAVVAFLSAGRASRQRFGCLVSAVLVRLAPGLWRCTRGIARTVAAAFITAQHAVFVALAFARFVVRHVASERTLDNAARRAIEKKQMLTASKVFRLTSR